MDNRNYLLNPGKSDLPLEQAVGWDIETEALCGRLPLELSAEATLIVQDGLIKQSNPVMAEMSAYAIEEILGTCVASFFDTEHIAAVELLCEQVRQGLESPQQLEATLVCKNGRRVLTQITAVPCTFDQRPACLLKIRHPGITTMPLEATSQDEADFFSTTG